MGTCLMQVAIILLSLTLLPVAACTTVAKRAFYEVRGARGKMLLNAVLPEGALARYQNVRFTPATTSLSPLLCPRDVIESYDRHARTQVNELSDVYPGSTPELVIDTEILYFQKKGLLGRAQLLTRVKLHGDNGLAVDGLVNTQSKAFRAGGADKLARTSVEVLGDFLRKQKE